MNIKPIIALVSGPIILCGLFSQTVQAGTVTVESGVATLADSLGVATGDEALTVNYSVTQDTISDIYTYTYTVNNPAGDVLLAPNSGSEVVAFFTVDFNTVTPGAFFGQSGVLPVGLEGANPTGPYWNLLTPLVAAGTSSAPLSFESDDAPTWGNASANDGNPPSPWTSVPPGQQVPVPNVPDSASTMTLLGGMMMLLPFRSALRNRK